MLDCSGRRTRDLPHWKYSEMGGCYGAPGPGPVVAAMLGGTPVMGGARAGRPWPTLDMAHPPPPPAHQAPAHLTADGFARYGVYSLLPSDVYAAPRYAHAQAAPTAAPAPATAYHPLMAPAHKECVFTYPAGPGSPATYGAPVVERGISQLQELMAKGLDKKPRLLEPAPDRRPKRRSWESAPQDDPGCSCRGEKTPAVSPGCSRTTPVSLRPAPQVKREAATPAPGHTPGHTPCQVAEVTTSAVKVKQEVVDPPAPAPAAPSATSAAQGGIPVGIAVARQRSQAQEVRVKEDAVVPPLAVLACERPTNQTPLWATPPAFPMFPPPAYWHAPPEQHAPLQPPMGYQLVRDPLSGQLLLISTGANIADSLQRAIVWPNNMGGFPSAPLLLPQPPPVGHVLLDRLVTLATPTPPPLQHDKRRPPATPHGLLKIDDPNIAGVMPCAKSSVVIQQLSAHAGPAPLLNPQFSAIASSGSVLIQHISGSNTAPAIIPHQNTGSVLISAQQLTTEAQGLISGHQPHPGQPQVVISHNHQDQSSVISPHVIGQLSSELLGSHGHAPQLPLVIAAPQHAPPQSDAQLHVQLKESPKPEIEDEPESADDHLDEKMEPVNCCRSQATSPVPCASPGQLSQSEDETTQPQSQPQQADASNQTDSLPPSSDEEVEAEPPCLPEATQITDADVNASADTEPAQEKTEAVDLSGLELLSAASMVQFQRSHSAPLLDAPKIKTEVEDPDESAVVPTDVVIKKEVEVEEAVVKVEETASEEQMEEEPCVEAVAGGCERGEGGFMGGLGLLCDVVHRVIEEEEAANSRPHSPCDDGDHDNKSTGWTETEDLAEDYKSPDREASHSRKSLPRYRPDSPLDPAELDMRERLAELQRLYREKQRELSRLTPRKSVSSDTSSSSSGCPSKRGPGRPRKVSGGTKRPRSPSPATSPSPQLSPPVLEPWNLPPPTLTPNKTSHKEVDVQQVEWELVSPSKSPPPLSPAQSPSSASKKRKVGRPKKREDHGSLTIVAKKPRSKSSLVGLLLAKKHLPEHSQHKIKPKLKAEVKVKSWCEEEEEWTTQPARRHSAPASPPPPTPAPGRPVKSKSLPTPAKTPHKKPILVLAKRKRTVSTEQPSVKTTSPRPMHAQGVVSCQLTAEHLAPAALPCRVLVTMGGLLYAGTLSAIRPPDLYGTTLDGERGNRPHILSREEILKDAILEVCTAAAPPPGTRVCAYWSQQYRCLYPGTVPPPGPEDSDPRFVCVEFDDGDNGRISLDDIRLLPQDYPVVAYDPNPLQTLGKRRRRNSGASCDSQSKEKPAQPMETVTELEAENEPDAEQETIQETEQQEQTEQVVPPEEQHGKEADEEAATAVQTVTQTEHVTLSLEAAERERERRRLKKKRKEKLRRLDSEKKHRHKHHDCLKSHRHKHKHRHHRHKHRHSKNIVSVMPESGGHVEEKKPLTLVVHTKPAADGLSPPIVSTIKIKKDKKRGRGHTTGQDSATPRSKMAAFLPARQLWGWSGRPYKRPGARGRARKEFYKTIQRGKETISVGDCAVFLSTGRPDRPYIGRIEAMWENRFQTMVVKVRWFYHPEETVGCPDKLPYPGALFESPHTDENDVQTVSHRCDVLPLPDYRRRLVEEPHRLAAVYDYNDCYYLAGHYNPTDLSLQLQPGVV